MSTKPSFSEIDATIKEIENLFKRESYKKEDIIKIMNKILPNFNHIETGKSLDQKILFILVKLLLKVSF